MKHLFFLSVISLCCLPFWSCNEDDEPERGPQGISGVFLGAVYMMKDGQKHVVEHDTIVFPPDEDELTISFSSWGGIYEGCFQILLENGDISAELIDAIDPLNPRRADDSVYNPYYQDPEYRYNYIYHQHVKVTAKGNNDSYRYIRFRLDSKGIPHESYFTVIKKGPVIIQ